MVDTSNLSSLHGLLTAVLPSWMRAHKQLRKANRLASLNSVKDATTAIDTNIFRLPKAPPKLLPVAAINFAVRKGKVQRAKSQWIAQMRSLFLDVIQQSEQAPPADGSLKHMNYEGLKQVICESP